MEDIPAESDRSSLWLRGLWLFPEFSGFSQDEKVQKLPACLISSEAEHSIKWLLAESLRTGGVIPHSQPSRTHELMDGISL